MKPILRRAVAAAAIAGGLLATAQVPALAAPKVVTPSITITASSKYGVVVGYLIVGYKSGKYSTATVSGTMAGLTAADQTDVVKLYAQPFKKPATVVATSAALKTSTKYSFNVTPSVFTHYQVKLFRTAKTAAPLASSEVQDIYVVSGGKVTGIKRCAQQNCKQVITATIYVPASARGAEMKKTVYPYLGLSTGTNPPPPTTLYRNGVSVGTAKASAAVAVKGHADQYRVTITFTFNTGTKAYSWNWAACGKDSVTLDGLGLPGTHHCGDPSISTSLAYLG